MGRPVESFAGLIKSTLIKNGQVRNNVFINRYYNTRTVKCYNATREQIDAVMALAESMNINVTYKPRPAPRGYYYGSTSSIFAFDYSVNKLAQMSCADKAFL